jgi:hypothetical protein
MNLCQNQPFTLGANSAAERHTQKRYAMQHSLLHGDPAATYNRAPLAAPAPRERTTTTHRASATPAALMQSTCMHIQQTLARPADVGKSGLWQSSHWQKTNRQYWAAAQLHITYQCTTALLNSSWAAQQHTGVLPSKRWHHTAASITMPHP